MKKFTTCLIIITFLILICVRGDNMDNQTFHASKFISKLQNGEAATVVFLGDSTTEQNSTTNGEPNHVGRIKTWLEGIYGVGSINVINAGISGNTIVQMNERLYSDVLSYNPDLVIISTGINDVSGVNKITIEEFKTSYTLVIQEIMAQTDCDVILRTPNETQDSQINEGLIEYNKVVEALAYKYNLGYFDLFAKMQADTDSGSIILSDLMQDVVHPNQYGHEYIFQNFKPYFEKTLFAQRPLANYKMLSANGDINLKDTGATLIAGTKFMNGYVLAFNAPGKSLEFKYVGGDFSIIFAGATSTGQFKVVIDGKEQPIVDTYRSTYKTRQFVTYKVPKVPKTLHTVQIQGLSTKNAASTSTNLQIQGVIYNN